MLVSTLWYCWVYFLVVCSIDPTPENIPSGCFFKHLLALCICIHFHLKHHILKYFLVVVEFVSGYVDRGIINRCSFLGLFWCLHLVLTHLRYTQQPSWLLSLICWLVCSCWSIKFNPPAMHSFSLILNFFYSS